MIKQLTLKKLIDYDLGTGVVNTECTITLREIGFMQINIEGKNYKLHEILYILVYGELPKDAIVIYNNGNRLDNRLDNLGIGYTYKQQRVKDANNKKNRKQRSINKEKRKQEANRLRVRAMFDKM